ncbi:MAG TPA: ABC transporter ATP-binding protein [Aggregatilineales bacterium]|nr:ABC transporter ATP-binding protein [Aggregatilineales bacterium]
MSDFDIEFINVIKEFPGRRGEPPMRAVNNISFQIKKGEFFALLGPSGCGKTTSLRMIAGFEHPTSGEILLRGKPVQDMPPFHRPVNTVFQDYALFPHMTAVQNIMFGLEMEGVKRKEAEERARRTLEMVQLPQVANRKPGSLSGGQQQRVALARALVKNPTVLLLDEPLGALDLKLRKEMQFELKQMQHQLGITFIFVTHDQEEAMTMADRIAVMDHGIVLQVGSPEAIYEAPHTRFVADFIGETNFITGTLQEKTAANMGTVLLSDGSSIRAVIDNPDITLDIPVTVAIRHEKISLSATGDNIPGNNVSVPGTVRQSVYIGTDTRYMVALGDTSQEITVRVQNLGHSLDQRFQPGQSVTVYWVDENARILSD